MSADCEVDGCGVVALGRCRACGKAFCKSHQGRYERGATYVDWCIRCLEADGRSKGDRRFIVDDPDDVERREEAKRFMYRDAAALLLERNVPSVRIGTPQTRTRVEKTLFGRGRSITTTELGECHPGWVIGGYSWYTSGSGVQLLIAVSSFMVPSCDLSTGTNTWPGWRSGDTYHCEHLRNQGPPQSYVYRVEYDSKFDVYVPGSSRARYNTRHDVWLAMATAVHKLAETGGQ